MLGNKLLLKLKGARNSKGFRVFCAVILAFFPVFLVLISEYNQMQSLGGLFLFFCNNFGIFVFDVLLVGLIYSCLLFLVGKGWVAALSAGGVVFIISSVEFFKFDVSRSHLLPQDLALTGHLREISGMARLHFTPVLFICMFLLALYILLLAFAGAGVRLKTYKRVITGILCIAAAAAVLLTPVSGYVYGFFRIDNRESVNVLVANSKFEKNNMIAFLSSELSHIITSRPSKPDNYSREAVLDIIASSGKGAENGLRANVIVVMNESYGDFRRLGAADDSYYINFDAAVEKGYGGTAVAPAFGGYTCRSEFEFLSGTPLCSFSNPVLPHKLFKTKKIEGIPSLFASLGYKTTYIHPYNGDFYERRKIYPSYGFQNMLYQEDFDIEQNLFRNYIDDGVLFSRAAEIIAADEEPSFIFIMTMQNHQPYFYEAAQGVDELGYYLKGVANTDKRLGELVSAIDSLSEPTLLFFIGDHLPFFGLSGNFYERSDFNETNCGVLFELSFLLYSNYGADFSALPNQNISLFYLPYYILQLSNPSSYPVIADAMIEISRRLPVYCSAYHTQAFERNAALDMLAYDRILGEGYSAGLGNVSR
jgi:phosphoglycerol transferase MdoB-like AlkP superfamily enzyme